mmetsp:Transcript_96602/g.155832  ORF Transcript_96602/g.155832 Transcript_96602/m.155832 type:complete len:112 (+) Transcript_96602:45-380(+)
MAANGNGRGVVDFLFFGLFQMNSMYRVNLVCCLFGGSVSAHSTKIPGAQRALRGRWLCGGTAAAAVTVTIEGGRKKEEQKEVAGNQKEHSCAPNVGLEPTTTRLRVLRSAD